MEITLREATMDDCDDLYHWRNDSVTREQSFDSKIVPYEEHQKWFQKAREDTNRLFFIGIDDKNERCGVVRFDIKDDLFAEINVNVSPEKRGEKIGTQLISKSCPLFFLKTKRKMILARTKEKNTASIKVFERAGFTELFRYNDTGGGVVVFVLLAPYGGMSDENPL